MTSTSAQPEVDLSHLREQLRLGIADDLAFDALYPDALRAKSSRFWTPVAVATRAAQLLAAHGARRILDVGSGAGKLCLVAAAVCPELDITGIEQRPHLVAAARRAASRLGLGNVRFLQGDATTPPGAEFDGLYLYNPFAENLYHGDETLDATVELSSSRFLADGRRMSRFLRAAPAGLCMVTYYGFGGPIPTSYRLAHAERTPCDWLRVWVKGAEQGDGGVFYEPE